MEKQKIFFEIAKNKLSPNLRLVDVICDTLNVSSDSAYRRLRGEKELTLSELVILCSHFDISMDSILNYESTNAIFRYASLDLSNIEVYYSYMDDLANLYEGLLHVKDKSILATAQDILIFHFLPYIEITFFKLYSWSHNISKDHKTYEEFIQILDKDRLEKTYSRIINAYKQIPSTEIWSINTIEPILSSIDYYYDMDCFESNKHPQIICYQLLQLIEDINKCAENEYKEFNGKRVPFRMYLSPINMENNFLITDRDGIKTTSVKLYTINGIFTSNSLFCEETEKWIKNLISKSSNFSGASARERFKFFQLLKNKINYLIEKLDKN